MPTRSICALAIATIAAILYAGLNRKDYPSSNLVDCSDDGWIRFGNYGIAYTQPLPEPVNGKARKVAFVLRMTIMPRSRKDKFRVIAGLYNKLDVQWLVGQWGDEIIVLADDDFDHSQESPRLSAKISSSEALEISIEAEEGIAKLLIDGEIVDENRDLVLEDPMQIGTPRLVLGNSIDRGQAWDGGIGEFVYRSGGWIALHFKFRADGSRSAVDLSGGGIGLEYPTRAKGLPKAFFRMGADGQSFFDRGMLKDKVINLLGFIPLGVILGTLWSRLGRPACSGWAFVGLATCVGFVLSFAIEFSQASIPSRTSSLPDLALNTLGTFVGAALILICLKTTNRIATAQSTEPIL